MSCFCERVSINCKNTIKIVKKKDFRDKVHALLVKTYLQHFNSLVIADRESLLNSSVVRETGQFSALSKIKTFPQAFAMSQWVQCARLAQHIENTT